MRIGVVGCHPLVFRAVAAEVIGERIDCRLPFLCENRFGTVIVGNELKSLPHPLTPSAGGKQGEEQQKQGNISDSQAFHNAKLANKMEKQQNNQYKIKEFPFLYSTICYFP